MKWVENIVGKRKMLATASNFPFPTMFSKGFSPRVIQIWGLYYKVLRHCQISLYYWSTKQHKNVRMCWISGTKDPLWRLTVEPRSIVKGFDKSAKMFESSQAARFAQPEMNRNFL